VPRTYGSCCHGDGSCTDEDDEAACSTAGGVFGEIGSECADVVCPGPGDTCDNPTPVTLQCC
jgi:hypothetical protein